MPNAFPEGLVPEIERILSQHATWPAGQDSYSALFDSQLFFPLQRRRELEAMMRRCRQVRQIPCPTCFGSRRHLSALDEMNCGTCKGTGMFGVAKTVMVIGSDKGSDLFHFVKCLPTVRKAIACEIRGTPYAEAFQRYFPDVEFLFLPMGSLDPVALSETRNFLASDKIDCLFIDGDKCTFKEDFKAYRHLMSPGGLVLMHDICCPPDTASCADAFAEAAKTHRTEKIVDMSEYDEDREAVKRGEPTKSSYGQWTRYWSSQYSTCGVGIIYI